MMLASESKALHIVSWVLQIAIALMFLMVGVQKLMGTFPSPQLFEKIGSWAEPAVRYFVGLWEVAAAVLLLIPKFRIYGALLVVLAMIGAFGAHIATPLGMTPEFVDPSDPTGGTTSMPGFVSLVFLALGAAVVFLRRNELPIGKRSVGTPGEI